MRRSKKGFTLIELLIVVAIIAILAAIAVPNFLEAQTRAKVARAKADMRTVATAVEAYAVDWNIPPLGHTLLMNTKCVSKALTWADTPVLRSYRMMTTPVSYITAIPDDPFLTQGRVRSLAETKIEYAVRYYWYDSVTCSALTAYGGAGTARTEGYTWLMYSHGPSRQANNAGHWNIIIGNVAWAGPSNGTVSVYDATNGTMSLGWIFRTNKGEFRGPPRIY